jgi:ABC-type hemin transport system ATPase subunit
MKTKTPAQIRAMTAEKQRVVDTARRQIEQLPGGEFKRIGMMQRLAELAQKHGLKVRKP